METLGLLFHFARFTRGIMKGKYHVRLLFIFCLTYLKGENFMLGINYSTDSNYQEILKPDRILTDASIPHTLDRLFDGWQVCYPTREHPERAMDAIEHYGSYGKDEDKLEIMGLLTPDEEEYDSVLGYLTAEDVFERIRKHHNGEWDKYVNDLVKKTSEEDTEKNDSPESSDSHIMTPEEFAKAMRKISDMIIELAVSKLAESSNEQRHSKRKMTSAIEESKL